MNTKHLILLFFLSTLLISTIDCRHRRRRHHKKKKHSLSHYHYYKTVVQTLTPKQQCIRKVVRIYKYHFIRWFIYHRAKVLRRRLIHKLRRRRGRRLFLRHSLYMRYYNRHSRHHRHLRHHLRRRYYSHRFHRYMYRHRFRLRRHRYYRRRHVRIGRRWKRRRRMKAKLMFLHLNLRRLRRRYRLVKYMRRNWYKMISYKKRWLYREVREMNDINTALYYFKNFPKKYRIRLSRCKLNLKPSMERCDSLHGKGNCVKLSPAMVHSKCPKGMVRVGCCSCAKPCPKKYFKTRGYYCLRTRVYKLDKFKTAKECKLQNHGKCYKASKAWVPSCAKGFLREGQNCRIACPKGYKMFHGKCGRLDITSLGSPFTWIHSDK